MYLSGAILVIAISTASGTGYTYLGCFQDNSTYPDLSGSSQSMTNLTVDSCATKCRTQGFPYAGLQEGTKCMCGDTYNQRGPSTGCTTCTLPDTCGGVNANDVYYTEDPTVTGRRPVAYSASNAYVNARRTCIQNGGDLIVPNSQAVVDSIVQLWSGSGVASVWIGLRRRTSTSVVYEWTDATVQPDYYSQRSTYSTYWTSGDTQVEDCVSLDLVTGKWKSVSCDTALPYTCNQPGLSDTSTIETNDATGESSSKKNKRLALFIVLPIFLFCYGGSCILYCVHKIIKNCTKKPPAKVPIDQMESANRYSDHPFRPKRPLSASKGRVHPMAPPVGVGLDIPAKAMPSYIPQTGHLAMGGKPTTEYKPGLDPNQRPSSSSGVHLTVGGANLLAPPPPYSDEKRARLLENAARESRERRAKEEAEGRPFSSPFAGQKRGQGTGDESPRDQVSPQSTGSTVNLLGVKGGHDDDDDDVGPSGKNSPLSINEILKRKVQEKKPKKIVGT